MINVLTERDEIDSHDQTVKTLDGTGKVPVTEARKQRMKLHHGPSPKGSKTDEVKLAKLREILSRDGVLKSSGCVWNEVDSSFSSDFRQLSKAIFSPVWEPLNMKDVGQVRYDDISYHCTLSS